MSTLALATDFATFNNLKREEWETYFFGVIRKYPRAAIIPVLDETPERNLIAYGCHDEARLTMTKDGKVRPAITKLLGHTIILRSKQEQVDPWHKPLYFEAWRTAYCLLYNLPVEITKYSTPKTIEQLFIEKGPKYV